MISIVQLEYIVAVDRYKNIQKAAEKSFVSQPALSMQIKKVEEELEIQIFDRRKHPIEATKIGKDFIKQAKLVLDEHQKLKRMVERSKNDFQGEINIGVIPTVANYLVTDLYQINRRALPNLTFNIYELKTNEVIDALKSREIDMGIISGPFASKNLQIHSLFYEPILIYGKNRGTHFLIEDLEEYRPWLLKEGNCLRNQMVNFCDLRGQSQSNTMYEGNSLQTLIDLIEIDDGFTLLPELSVEHLKLNPDNIYEFKDSIPARNIIALSQKRNANEAIIQLISESIRGLKKDYLNEDSAFDLVEWD
ncbi:MAG: LysR family transcriptional regulator [Crocinitomicaceae bacterium]|nr:LysR family transcriptional regulator [Crocinitomicaceae bacterium]